MSLLSRLRRAHLWASLLLLPAAAPAVENATRSPWYPFGFGGGGFMMSADTLPASGSGPYTVLTGCDSSAGFASFDSGASWTQLADPSTMGGTKMDGATVFTTAAFDPADASGRSFFMGQGGSIYRVQSTAGSYTYTSVLTGAGAGVSSIAFAPGSGSATGYAGTGGARSFMNSGFGRSLGDTAYPLSVPTIYKTTTGGSAWSAVAALPLPTGYTNGTVFKVVPVTASRVYVATDVGLYLTTDAGTSWAQIGNTGSAPLPHNALFGLAVVPGGGAGSDTLYVTLQPYADIKAYVTDPAGYLGLHPNYAGGLFKSTDSGATWSQLTLGTAFTGPGLFWDETTHLYDVVVSPSNSSRIYVADTNPASNADGIANSGDSSCVYFSANGGGTFSPLNLYSSSDNYIGAFQPQRLAVHALSSSLDDVFVMGENAGQFKGTGAGTAMTFASVSTSANPTPPLNQASTKAGTTDNVFRGWGLDAGLGGRVSQDPIDPSIVFYNDKDRGFWRSMDYGNSFRFIYNPSLAQQGDGRGCFPDPDYDQYVYAYIGRKDFRLADPSNPHFVISTSAGVPTVPGRPFGSGFDQDHRLPGLPDLFAWDVALDPTVLAQVDVDQRKLYLAEGDGPYSPFQIIVDLDNRVYDVYLNYVKLNATALPFYHSGSADISSLQFSVTGAAGSFYLDNYSFLSSTAPALAAAGTLLSESANFNTGCPSGWTPGSTGAGSALAKADFSSPTAGAMLLAGAAGGSATLTHALLGDYTAGEVQINFQVLPNEVSGTKNVCQVLDNGGNLVAAVVLEGSHVEAMTQTSGGIPEELDLSTSAISTQIRPPEQHIGVYVRTGSFGSYTWSNLATDPGLPSTACLRQMQLDPSAATPGDLLALDINFNGGYYRHSAASSTWTSLLSCDQPRAFAVWPGSAGDIMVLAASSGGVNTLYLDGGSGTLTPIANPAGLLSTQEYVSLRHIAGNDLYAGTSNGVYYTPDITAVTPAWTPLFDGLGFGSIYNLDNPSSVWGSSLTAGRQGSGSMRSDFLPFTVVKYQAKVGSDLGDSQYYIPTIAFDAGRPYLDADWQVPQYPAVFGIGRNHLYCFTTADADKASTLATQVKVKIDQPTVVYVAVAAGYAPSWLATSGFTSVPGGSFNLQRRDSASVQAMMLYSAALGANTALTLGGASVGTSGTSPVNYFVLVQPAPQFSADFTSSDLSAWSTIGTWTRASYLGNEVYEAPSGSGTAEAVAGPTVLEASIEATVLTDSAWVTGSSAGLIGRSDGAGDEYRFIYLPTASNADTTLGQMRLIRVNGGVKTTLATVEYSTSPLTAGTAYRFSLVVRGNLLIGSIDGVQVISASDRNPPTPVGAGQFGLLSEKNPTIFDNYSEITY